MLRSQFEEELQALHTQFYEMGMAVSDSIYQSAKAFVNHDPELAQTVIEKDATINQFELSLEKKSFEMIALQQPVTTDLRMIVTVLKASSDLERMGDHAVSMAKATIRVKGKTRIPEIELEISKMADVVKDMVEQVLTAYIQKDTEAAKAISAADAEVNQYFKGIYKNCIKQMQRDPETVVGGADYLQVAGFLERIGDYVTNICEWIVYLKTGKIEELG